MAANGVACGNVWLHVQLAGSMLAGSFVASALSSSASVWLSNSWPSWPSAQPAGLNEASRVAWQLLKS